ncbi:MAG: AI-2E family transporter [Planctomycetota bacterium]|nr:AI-2E family transporter [Planctomycetota bacterium]
MTNDAQKSGTGARVLLSIAAFTVVVAGLHAAAPVVVPILAAIMIATITIPPIAWLMKHGVSKWVAGAIVLLAMLAFLGSVSYVSATTAAEFTADLPRFREAFAAQIDSIAAMLRERGWSDAATSLPELLTGASVFQMAGQFATGAAGLAKDVFFVLVATLFLLAEAATLPEKIRQAFGVDADRYGRLAGVVDAMQRYLLLKTQTSALTGILVYALLLAFGVKFALALALLAFILNFVPVVGAIVAAVPPILLMLVDGGLTKTITLALIYIGINIGIGNFLEPRLFGRSLGLSPLVVFLSLVVWGWILGPVGMFLSVPPTMLVKILVDEVDDLRWVSVLLGSGAPRPETKTRGS